MSADCSKEAMARAHTRCRVCGSRELVRYLDLGSTPLANAYVPPDQLGDPEFTAELAVQLCLSCGLSQLTRVVDPDHMFRDYLYVSSTTSTFREHCAELARTAVALAGAAQGSWVLDIASNDGLLLSRFRDLGMRVFGVDPARELAARASEGGIPTLAEYWTEATADDAIATFGRPSIVTATNVLGHVDGLHAFVAAVDRALAPGGLFVAEFPWVVDLVERNEFDTIYHEHLSYLSLHPLRDLLEAHGLSVFDVEHFPDIHGGTLRVAASRSGDRPARSSVAALLERERTFGLTDQRTYAAFSRRTDRNMTELREVIDRLASDGRRVWAYGASAKGNTLMNFAGLTAAQVPVVADDNERKWGLFTPGARMRIASPAELATADVDLLLLLAWNFETEIVRRSRAAGHRGGFIRPVPTVELFDA